MEEYTVKHFSQSNPAGPGQESVPDLLRRVAATLDGMGTIEVQDLILHNEICPEGASWPSITVYYTS
ncbi:MAG: hypothetical protein ACRC20_09000 [Segniliparus sp.]|uniref:hypothetical protein n=1 Tax=Segniliparus sp. TaxID=2804064 RepID=UPI003F38055B